MLCRLFSFKKGTWPLIMDWLHLFWLIDNLFQIRNNHITLSIVNKNTSKNTWIPRWVGCTHYLFVGLFSAVIIFLSNKTRWEPWWWELVGSFAQLAAWWYLGRLSDSESDFVTAGDITTLITHQWSSKCFATYPTIKDFTGFLRGLGFEFFGYLCH